ncbi:myosin-J heavy chain-like [Limulus polyphemus]|uniref:Myosin-J heavy chain-like n=1 Tax=Limulus polyphemus TaxID=6850 RepID=A0ABM1SWT2_LIMPO|nr:myosin-J heavy chain-like [Limulus polyphemus]
MKNCLKNIEQHNDVLTTKQGTKEQMTLGNINTSQNFIEITDSLADSAVAGTPQAAVSFRLVSSPKQEENRKVHSKSSAAQPSLISESNLEKKEPEVVNQICLNSTQNELTMSNPPMSFTKINTNIDGSMILPDSLLDTEEISLKDIEKCMKKPIRKTFTIHVDTQDWEQLNSKSMNTLEMFNELCSEAASKEGCKDSKEEIEEVAHDFSCTQKREEMYTETMKEHNETQISNVSTHVKNNKSCTLKVEDSSLDTKKLEPSCNLEISSYNNLKTSYSCPKIISLCPLNEGNDKNFSLNENTELEKISEEKLSKILKNTSSSCEKSNDVISQFRRNDSMTPSLDLNSQQFVATSLIPNVNKSYVKRWEILLETITNSSTSKTIKLSDSTVKLEVTIENETLVLSVSSVSDKEKKDVTTQVDTGFCLKANHKSIQTDQSLFIEDKEKDQCYGNLQNEGTKQITCVDRNSIENLNQLIQKDFTTSSREDVKPGLVLNQSAATFEEQNFRVGFNENVKLNNSDKDSLVHIKLDNPSNSRLEIFQPVITYECGPNSVSDLTTCNEKVDVYKATIQEAKSVSSLNKMDHVINTGTVEVAKTDSKSSDMKIFEKNHSNTTTFKKSFTENIKSRGQSFVDKKEKSYLNSEKSDFTLEIISPSVQDDENSNSQSVLFDKLISAYKISSSDADALFAAELIDPLETLTTRQQSSGTVSCTSRKLKPIKESNDRSEQDLLTTENLNNRCDETRALVNTELYKFADESVQEKKCNQQEMSLCDNDQTKLCHKVLRRKKFHRIRQLSDSSDSSDEELLDVKGNLKRTAVISNVERQPPQLSNEMLKEEDRQNQSSTQLYKQDNQLQRLGQYVEKCHKFSAENTYVEERFQWPSNEIYISKGQTCKLFQEHSTKGMCEEEHQKTNLLEGHSEFTGQKSNTLDPSHRPAQNSEEQFDFTEQLRDAKLLDQLTDQKENLKEINSSQCSEELVKKPFTLNTDIDNKDLFEQSVNHSVVCVNEVSTNFDESCRQVGNLVNTFPGADHQTQDILDRQKEPLDSKAVLMEDLSKSQVSSWNKNELEVLEKSLQQDTQSSNILSHIQVSCRKDVLPRQISTFTSQETQRSGATSNDMTTSSAWSSQGESLSGDPDLIKKEIEEMKQRILQMEALINGSRPICNSKDITLGDQDLDNNSHQKTLLPVQNISSKQKNSYDDRTSRGKTSSWDFKNDEDSGEESDDLFNTVSPTPPKRLRPDNCTSLLVSFSSAMKRNKTCHT